MGACAFAATPTRVLPQLPVRFEPQVGHSAPASAIQWSANGLGYSLAFTADATMFRLGERTLALRFLGADPHATFEAAAPYSVPTQYFTAAYRGSVQSYRRLRRHQVYPASTWSTTEPATIWNTILKSPLEPIPRASACASTALTTCEWQ